LLVFLIIYRKINNEIKEVFLMASTNSLQVNFKQGTEESLKSALGKEITDSNWQRGEVRFTSNGNYGKIWYRDGNGKVLNIIPDAIDAGTWLSTAATNYAPLMSIKRYEGTNNVSTLIALNNGELGYHANTQGLYIGQSG
jgi:hypothetical protein